MYYKNRHWYQSPLSCTGKKRSKRHDLKTATTSTKKLIILFYIFLYISDAIKWKLRVTLVQNAKGEADSYYILLIRIRINYSFSSTSIVVTGRVFSLPVPV